MEKLRPYCVYIMRDEFSNIPLFVGVNISLTEFLESVNACFIRFSKDDGVVRSYEVVGEAEDRIGGLTHVDIYDHYIENPNKRFIALNVSVSVQEFSLGNVVEL